LKHAVQAKGIAMGMGGRGWRRIAAFGAVAGLAAGLLVGQSLPATHVDNFQGKPRMIVISDIGNEPDDQMSLVRLLLYSNEMEIEALIATTSTWQRKATHPETMRALVEAYGHVRRKLLLNAKGWPEASDLMSRVYAGQSAYGLAATGDGKSSDGSKAIVRAVERDDPMDLPMGRRQYAGPGAN
jgi:hypothetical protein